MRIAFHLIGVLVLFGAFAAQTNAAPVTVSFQAGPNTVVVGPGTNTSTYLSWTSTNATRCSITKTGEGSSVIMANGPASGSKMDSTIFDPTTYTLTCSGPSGSASASKTIRVSFVGAGTVGSGLCGQVLGCVVIGTIALPCSVSLFSDKTSITPGQSALLNWVSLWSSNVNIINYGPVTSSLQYAAYTGSVSVSPSVTTTYTAQCTWGGTGFAGYVGGTSNSAPITITVANPQISGSCSASPSSLTIGGTTTWTANASGGNGTYAYSWSGTDSLSGSSRTVNKTYSSAGTKTASVTITSGGSSQPISCSNSVSVANPPPQCSDGIDNDNDGRIDLADYGCTTAGGGGNPANDPSESPNPQCSDGIDNNGNGLIDTADVGACTGPTDGNEQPLPTSSLALTAPALVRPTSAVTLTWSASNVRAGTCTLVGTNGNSWNLTGTSGTRTSSTLTSETVFTLTCTDLNGQPQNATVTVRVAPSFEEI